MSEERHVIHEPVTSVTPDGQVVVTQDEEHLFVTNPACGEDNTFPPAGGLSMRCGARYFGCDDLSCTCVCHDRAEEYHRQLDKQIGLRLEDVRRLFDIPEHLLPEMPPRLAAPYAPALPWAEIVSRYQEIFPDPPTEPLCCRMSTADLDKLRAGTLQLDPDVERELKRHATIPAGVPDSMRPLFGLPIVIDETAAAPRLEPIPPITTSKESFDV